MIALMLLLFAGLILVRQLMANDGSASSKIVIWLPYIPVALSAATLALILATAPNHSGTIQYEPDGFFPWARFAGFGACVVCIPASIVCACILGYRLAAHHTLRSLRRLVASLVIVLEAILCYSYWISTGAFPRV